MDEIRTKVFSAFLPASWQISAKTKDITLNLSACWPEAEEEPEKRISLRTGT